MANPSLPHRAVANRGSAHAQPNLARKLREAYAAQQSGHLDKAARLYTAVLRERPHEFDALHMLGLVEYQRGRLAEALRLIGAALRSHDRSADAWSNLGLVFHAQGEFDRALRSYDQALAVKPDHAEVLNNRGNALKTLGRHDSAVESFSRAVAVKPDYVFAHYNLGSTLLDLGRAAEALSSFDAALAIAPNHADTLCHRGNALMRMNRVEEAFSSYALALGAAPDNPLILHNHALALRHLGRPREALVSAEKALRIKPDYAPARFEESLALLALGDLRRGFAAYEARWNLAEFKPQWRNFAAPLWLGEDDIAGKTLLLHAEQGFGDTLHFVRYVPLLAQRGASIVLEVQPQLKSLLRGMAGAAAVIGHGEPLPAFDRHCPLMSLPLAVGTERDAIPAAVPYIATDPAKTAHWAERLSSYADKKKIGLVWAGEARKHNPNAHAIDTRRSIRLSQFAPLADIPNIQFFSLQKGEPAADAAQPPHGMPLLDPTSALHGFDDTAALIANLDLVISVDTAVAHLAGALAKPVWILSRFDACWRWLDRREDSPWYPTARLFHQKSPGDWDDVIARVKSALSCTLRSSA